MKKTAEQILKEIKCTTKIKEVKEFEFEHTDIAEDVWEEYFKIYTSEGDVIGRILKFADGTVKSKLDYCSDLEFNRNVNFWEEV